ncbi:hypothetical protein NONO_c73170 [Nocardia nova SH22a]|uniref:Transmembrane protein n=1 Tax=Nocardia nova SH22a TaxID=1415166 RepID=W5TSD6_9NOCA|nr:terpene cyclase/mutase family protein [Nocardia nova]AHH22074.1 hypothetical protein NONO_c73170 [Nocardia nova SH22a]
MSNIDERIRTAVEWLRGSQIPHPGGGAGWGWIPDVPPNPQNTAEVVCVLHRAGSEIPRAAKVTLLVQATVVQRPNGDEWYFRTPIDVAWRIRALRCLGIAESDPHLAGAVRSLLDQQDSETGGWRMSGFLGPVSITATAAAVEALIGIDGFTSVDGEQHQAISRGIGYLVAAVYQEPRSLPMYAAAHIATVLSRIEIVRIGDKRAERACELVVKRLLTGLRKGEYEIETEIFRRDDLIDTWRHLTLHLAVGAVISADSRAIFDPAVRAAIVALLDMQEMEALAIYRGGFRISDEGPVTSYATTQALEALLQVRPAINERVNPAKVYDEICRADGTHRTDPQAIASVRGHRMLMNSTAGQALSLLGTAAGLTVFGLAVSFAAVYGTVGSRALVVWGTVLVAFSTYCGLATRFPRLPKKRVASAVFGAFTALVMPVVTYLLA